MDDGTDERGGFGEDGGVPCSEALQPWLEEALGRRPDGLVVWLVGAGLSAESGIPTFRGPEGYWRRGSRHYTPMEPASGPSR